MERRDRSSFVVGIGEVVRAGEAMQTPGRPDDFRKPCNISKVVGFWARYAPAPRGRRKDPRRAGLQHFVASCGACPLERERDQARRLGHEDVCRNLGHVLHCDGC